MLDEPQAHTPPGTPGTRRAPTGRPRMLTPQVEARTLAAIRAGHPRSSAAAAAGISPATLYRYLAADDARARRFQQRVEEAEADLEASLLKPIDGPGTAGLPARADVPRAPLPAPLGLRSRERAASPRRTSSGLALAHERRGRRPRPHRTDGAEAARGDPPCARRAIDRPLGSSGSSGRSRWRRCGGRAMTAAREPVTTIDRGSAAVRASCRVHEQPAR